jgi:prenyltransferase beta subunit
MYWRDLQMKELRFSCQTYEGGFAGVPGMEAHGGYAFCGLAALFLMGKENLINLTAFTVNLLSSLSTNINIFI